MIVKCLQNSNDANPTQMQSLYMETVNNLDGIIQANAPTGSNPTPAGQSGSAEIPVVSLSMLGVSTDSDAALALGYGTIDIPLLDEIAEVLAIYAKYSGRSAQVNEQTLLAALAALAAIESRISLRLHGDGAVCFAVWHHAHSGCAFATSHSRRTGSKL